MIDENIWFNLTDEQKLEELENYLTEYRLLDSGNHEMSRTSRAGKIKFLKKELRAKIEKIIDLEHVK
jgi:uncharacterized protein YbcI